MRNCFVPNCDHNCRANPKRRMFKPPNDPALFEQWRTMLPKRRELRNTDRICERHFEKHHIVTTWDHTINGKLVQMPRDKATLAPMAVPTVNRICWRDEKTVEPSKNTVPNKKRAATKAKKTSRKSDVDCAEPTVENGTVERIPAKPTDHTTQDTDVEYSFDATTTKTGLVDSIDDIDSDHNVEMLSQSMESCSSVTIKNETQKTIDSKHQQQPQRIELVDDAQDDNDTSFETLYDDIYEVMLPDTMYGIHRDPERQHIVFTLFDVERMRTTKVLRIDRHQRRLQTFNDGKLIVDIQPSELTVDLVTSMLADLEALQKCGDVADY